jgi:hypothetical protein
MNIMAKWRWDSVERAAWDRSLLSKPCPECGGELRFSDVLGRWSCSDYGNCELACG